MRAGSSVCYQGFGAQKGGLDGVGPQSDRAAARFTVFRGRTGVVFTGTGSGRASPDQAGAVVQLG